MTVKEREINASPLPLKRRFNLMIYLQVGIALILFLSPFFRGLYFDNETLDFLILVGIITTFVAFKRFGEKDCWSKPSFDLIDLGFYSLALWYLLCIPFAASKGDAILGSIRVLGYVGLYYASGQLLMQRTVRIGAWILALTGSILTYVGIGSSVGLPPVTGSWGKTLSSTFQYHNALGGYLLMVIPVTLLLYREAKEGWQRNLAAGLLYFNLLGLVGSQSRGAYVFFVLVIFLALLAFRKKDIPLVSLLAVGLWGALDSWTQVAWAGNVKSYLVLIWPWVGFIGMLFTEWLWHGANGRTPPKNIRFIGGLLLVGVLIIGTLPLIAPAWGGGKATKNVVSQIQSIDTQDQNLQERFTFFQDALRMGMERPVFGFGGNGWEVAYKGYQSYLYHSKEPHSEPFRILVEAGIPGVVFYALIWVGFLQCWLKTWGDRSRNWSYMLGISLIGIFLHSLMDFDLSESSIFFTMVILMGVFRQESRNAATWDSDGLETLEDKQDLHKSRYSCRIGRGFSAAMLTLGIMLIVGSLTLKIGVGQAVLVADALSHERYDDVIHESQTALAYFPYQASVYANLAQAELNKGSEENKHDLFPLAVQHAERAITLNSTDPTLRRVAARVYSLTGNPGLAYQAAKKRIDLADLYPEGYEDCAQYALEYAEQLISQGKKENAKAVLNEVVNLPGQIDTRLGQLTERERRMWRSQPHLSVTPRLWLYHAEALAILGQRNSALTELEKIRLDKDYGSAATLLKGVIEQREGNEVQGAEDIRLALQVQPQMKDSVEKLTKLLATDL